MSRADLWRRWFAATTAGEVLGFGVPAVAGALAGDLALPVETVVLVAAGAVEGAVLGLAQGLVVRRALPAVTAGRWAAATALGAATAWLVAMTGVMLADASPPWPVLAPLALVLGTVLLLSIGTAQWWLLRGRVPSAGRWIGATAVAWVAALTAFTAVTTPLWQPGQSVGLIVAIGVLGGIVMAATMAAVTGWAFARIVSPSAQDEKLVQRTPR